MNTLIQSDIFFFITSIAVVAVTLCVIVVLVYAIKIARTISSIANTIKKESDNVIEDISELRGRVKEEGLKVSTFWRFVTSFFLERFTEKFTSSNSKSNKKHKAKNQDSEI